MACKLLFACLGLAASSAAQGTAAEWAQCGGIGFTGPLVCSSGLTCMVLNSYFYQCLAAATTSATSTSTSTSTTATPTSTSPKTTTSVPAAPAPAPTTTAASSTGTTANPGTPTTLLPGWFWIRAVEAPYFHSYLQTLPTATPGGDAVLDDPATAGQFSIASGQLVYNTGGSGAAPLYMWVEDAADKTKRALATWFNSTASTYGSFAFSGDTVTWTDPDVARPNTAAFYVCPAASGEKALFVNTGAYLYQTPSGCYDVDIHSYGGSTAVV